MIINLPSGLEQRAKIEYKGKIANAVKIFIDTFSKIVKEYRESYQPVVYDRIGTFEALVNAQVRNPKNQTINDNEVILHIPTSITESWNYYKGNPINTFQLLEDGYHCKHIPQYATERQINYFYNRVGHHAIRDACLAAKAAYPMVTIKVYGFDYIENTEY